MAVFRSLNALIRNRNPKRLFVTVSPSTTPLPRLSSILSPLPLSFASRFTYSHSRVLSPLCISIPFPGPLFLSSPPWMLSQSATPLLLQGDAVLRNVEALKLLRTRNFPICLGGFGSIRASPGLLGRLDQKQVISRDVDVAHGDFVKSFMNLPNLISFSRLASGPLLAWMISNEWYLSAFMGLAISGASDWLDGYMARKMGINYVIGSYLDPLADKVLIGCVALAMVEKDLIHPGLVGLVVLRDVALICGAVFKRASSLGWQWKSWFDFFNLDGMCPQKVEPLFISKVNTVLQLILVTAALLQPEFGTEETKLCVIYLSWLVASTTVASTAAYGAKHIRNGSKIITGMR